MKIWNKSKSSTLKRVVKISETFKKIAVMKKNAKKITVNMPSRRGKSVRILSRGSSPELTLLRPAPSALFGIELLAGIHGILLVRRLSVRSRLILESASKQAT